MNVSALLAAGASVLAPLTWWATLNAVNGRRRDGEPPLVRGALPYLGVAVSFGKNAGDFVTRCQADHGDVFTLFLAGRRMTFVLDPLSYPAVLKAKQLSFHPIGDDVLATAFGLPNLRGSMDVEAAEGLARTRLRGEPLTAMTDAMGGRLRTLIPEAVGSDWTERPLYRLVWDVMFRAGTDALFGHGLVTPELQSAFETFDKQFPLMVAGLPRVLTREGDEALGTLADAVKVGERPSDWIRDRDPLLDVLPRSHYGRAQSSVLWAINANTIPATFWSLFYLLQHPEALACIRDELATLSPDARKGLDVGTLKDLRHLDSAIREALRLSSGSLTVREVLEPFSLETRGGTYSLRQGDRVCLAPFVTHRDPEIYDAPETYQHDRFYTEGANKQFYKGGERVPLPLMPFGAGLSMCPGRFFAMNEIKLFVAMALDAWDVDLGRAPAPTFDYSRAGLGIYPPIHDVTVRVRSTTA